MSLFHQLDPAKFIVSVGTLPSPISGYAKGTFIEITRDEDTFKKFVGGDGEVTRVRNRNIAGMMKITLQQGSNSNAILSALATLDEQTGAGVVPITFMDMSGVAGAQSTAASAYGWIRKKPDMKFSGESEENREWIFDLARMDFLVGGN
jgi:hypothetical protein